jgi:hypothetical protein
LQNFFLSKRTALQPCRRAGLAEEPEEIKKRHHAERDAKEPKNETAGHR